MTGYLYDGKQTIAEFDCTGKVTTQYIHGPGLGADVGSMLCKETASGIQYYLYNWRGDVCEIINAQGTVTAQYRYDAFGNAIAGQQPQIGFSGKRYDASVSLSYFGARYYDARLGRFISRDPMEFVDGPNDYIIATNTPLLWIDPWGESKRFPGLEGLKSFDFDKFRQSLSFSSPAEFGKKALNEVFGVPLGIYDFYTEKGTYEKIWNETGIHNIYTNGILTSFEQAKENARSLNADLFYNPSRGFVADITQSFMQKTAGRFSPGSLETGYADVLQSLSGSKLSMISHSQGTATATTALEILHRRGVKLKEGSKAYFFAPITFTDRIKKASIDVGLPVENKDYFIRSRDKDSVPLLTSTLNPVSHINGWLNLPYVNKEHAFKNYREDAIKEGIL